jgi:hypothetical protein
MKQAFIDISKAIFANGCAIGITLLDVETVLRMIPVIITSAFTLVRLINEIKKPKNN